MNQFESGLLRYINAADLSKIQKIKIGIAGVGGLGSNCAMLLVRSGFRNFELADFDDVDDSNLNRQFYFYHQTGQSKLEALSINLALINPTVKIEMHKGKLDRSVLEGLFSGCDVVVEALDRAEEKKLVVEQFLHSGKLLVAASGLAGYGNSDRITTHKIKENFFIVGDLVTGISPETPPLAPCVTIAAAKQADIILSYVLK